MMNQNEIEVQESIVRLSLVVREKGKRTLKIYNTKNSSIKNVSIKFPDAQEKDVNVLALEDYSLINIEPHQEIEVYLLKVESSKSTILIEFEWENGSGFLHRELKYINIQ